MKNKPNNYPNSTRIKLLSIAINKPVKAKKNQWRRFERFDSLGEMPDEWWAKLQKRYEEAKKLQRININTRVRYRLFMDISGKVLIRA